MSSNPSPDNGNVAPARPIAQPHTKRAAGSVSPTIAHAIPSNEIGKRKPSGNDGPEEQNKRMKHHGEFVRDVATNLPFHNGEFANMQASASTGGSNIAKQASMDVPTASSRSENAQANQPPAPSSTSSTQAKKSAQIPSKSRPTENAAPSKIAGILDQIGVPDPPTVNVMRPREYIVNGNPVLIDPNDCILNWTRRTHPEIEKEFHAWAHREWNTQRNAWKIETGNHIRHIEENHAREKQNIVEQCNKRIQEHESQKYEEKQRYEAGVVRDLREARHRFQEMQRQNEQLQAMVQTATNNHQEILNKALADSDTRWSSQLNAAQEENKSLRAQLDEAHRKGPEMETIAKSEGDNYKKQIEDLASRLEGAIKYQLKFEDSNSRVSELEKSLLESQNDLENEKKSKAESLRKIEDLKKEIKEIKENERKAKAESVEEIKILEKEITKYKKDLETEAQAKQGSEQSTQLLKEEIEKSREKLENEIEEKSSLKKELSVLKAAERSRITTSEGAEAVTELYAEISRIKKDNVERTRDLLKQLAGSRAAKNMAIANLQAYKGHYDPTLRKLEDEIANLKEENGRLETECISMHRAWRIESIDRKQEKKKHDSLREEHEALRTNFQKFAEDLKGLKYQTSPATSRSTSSLGWFGTFRFLGKSAVACIALGPFVCLMFVLFGVIMGGWMLESIGCWLAKPF